MAPGTYAEGGRAMSGEMAEAIFLWVWGILAALIFVIGVTVTTRAWLNDKDDDLFGVAPLIMMIAMLGAGLWPAALLAIPVALVAGPQILWHRHAKKKEAKEQKRKDELREGYLAAASMFDKDSEEHKMLMRLAYEV